MKPSVALTFLQLMANPTSFIPPPPTNWIFKKQNQTIKPFHPRKFHCVALKDKGSKKMQHCCYTLKIYNSLMSKYLVSIQPS